jgi:elongation factor G
MAFKFAGSIAFTEAARKANPLVLEPVMAVEVTIPEEFMRTAIGDINARRGRVEGMEHVDGSQLIHAVVPLSEMLRSSTNGRPDYPMQFAGYEPIRHGGWFGDDGVGFTANKPNLPRAGSGSISVNLDIYPE